MDRLEALKLLELNGQFTDKDLKKAYIKMSKKYHPDTGGDAEMMKKINSAKEYLSEHKVIEHHEENNLGLYHLELILKLKEYLSGSNKNDFYYKEIKVIIDEFIDLDVNNITKDELDRVYIITVNKIIDVFWSIKNRFFKENNIPADFKYEFNVFTNLEDIYKQLKRIESEFEHFILSKIVINEVIKVNIDRYYYRFLEDKIKKICNDVLKEKFESNKLQEKINIINERIELLFIMYEDALEVLNIIASINNKENAKNIETIIRGFEFNYIDNYDYIHVIWLSLVNDDTTRKVIYTKKFIYKEYGSNTELLRRMLLDVNLVVNKFLDDKILKIILKRKYKDVDEYNEYINKYLDNKSGIYLKKNMFISFFYSIGVVSEAHDNFIYLTDGKYRWRVNKSRFNHFFSSLEAFLRGSRFYGSFVHNGKELLLYTNNVTGLYKSMANDELIFKDFDGEYGTSISHVDVDKYRDLNFMKKEIIDGLNVKLKTMDAQEVKRIRDIQ